MHEMGLARRIINIAQEKADSSGAKEITKITVTLGEMSGVMYESLDFAFKTILSGTALEKTKICINRIKALAQCQKCAHIYEPETLYDACPVCGAANPEILQGREFLISSIDVI